MMENTPLRRSIFFLSIIIVVTFQAQPQDYPPTITIPVTFYDFHGDGSNPDFEPGLKSGYGINAVGTGVVPNEVQNTLDASGKPVAGSACYFSYYVAKWFRPWQPGDFTIPTYAQDGSLTGVNTVAYDTAYKNIVFPESLTFTHQQNGIYQYSNQSFFVLDGQGFGADDPGGQNPPHNFSFTMELHWTFTYQPGLVFQFEGDDDVWVFINGQKVIDLGGIHSASAASVNLDNLTGMQVGKKYSFDLYYAERHVVASDIKITTNLFTPPGYLQLYGKPGAPNTPGNPPLGSIDTAVAGQGFPVYAHVFDSLQVWQPTNDSLVTWTVTDNLGNPILSTTTAGDSTAFTVTKAFGTVTITATFKDPANPSKIISKSLAVYISPGPGTHIVIEADSLARNTTNDRPIPVISVDRNTPATVYAVVRDQYGNFVRFATNASWSIRDPLIAAAAPKSGAQWTATVSELSYGGTVLTASESGLSPGTAPVSATGANTAIPVTAILLDTNADGHLDRIDIVYPDSVTLTSALPTVQQFLSSASIVSYDGGKTVILQPAGLVSGANHTLHIILVENTGPTLETGWIKPPDLTLTNVEMTTDKRAFYIANIIDGAEPVVKSVCFVPMPQADTLRVVFSEPVANAGTPINEYTVVTVVKNDGSLVAINSSTVTVTTSEDKMLYAFSQPGTLTNQDSVKSGSRAFPLGLCGDVSIVVSSRAAGNPFVPGATLIPPLQRPGPNDPSTGTRIEVTLLRAVAQDLPSGKVRGTVTIFDVVGNTVVDKEAMNPDMTNVKLYWIWDGRTRRGSWAAPGTYLARILIEDFVRDRKQSIRINIGIRK
ncbi:MAG TPA: fibro-slime domain-containing protein [Chitinivibrionales bacterium]|nr:fibro-slime domain-containing protein [Chitinivibrionales bacterium]